MGNIEDLEQLLKQYATKQHTREVYPINIIPSSGYTSGANNVYFTGTYIRFGVTSLELGEAWITYTLPNDYVDAQSLTFKIYYIIDASSATIDYAFLFQYAAESAAYANANTPSGQFTSDATANDLSIETFTVTGTNLKADDSLRFRLRMDDNASTTLLNILGFKLLVPVNTRT